jgi:hypothetical protein
MSTLLAQVRQGQRVDHFETRQRRKEGAPVDASLSFSPVETKDGQVVGISITARDVSEQKRYQAERERLISDLQVALAEVKTLKGLLPICGHCKKIRDDKGAWNQIESYIRDRSDATFTHGICPDCMQHHFSDLLKEGKSAE